MYQVFLGTIPLPITPSRIETKINGRNETVELVDGSQVPILRLPGLTEISFEFMIPSQNYPFASLVGSALGALTGALGAVGGLVQSALSSSLLYELERRKKDKEPFQFIVVRLGEGLSIVNAYNTNLKVTLEDYSIIEDAENGMDIIVSVNLRQYVPYSTKILNKDGTVTKTRP